MKQNELLEKIRKSADNIPVPHKLSPDHILDGLEDVAKEKKSKKRPYWLRYGGVAAAAGLALFVTLGILSGQSSRNISRENRSSYAAESYEDIYKEIRKIEKQRKEELAAAGGEMVAETAAGAEAGAEAGVETEISKGTGDYSQTNIQVQGVDEGDIVKTDGSYIYSLDPGEGCLTIVAADKEKLKKESQIQGILEENGSSEFGIVQEFYIWENKLSVLATNGETTAAVTYDISDKARPVKIGKVIQEGQYLSSRRSGDYLYVFTERWTYEKPRKMKEYIPEINGEIMAYQDIYLPDHVDNTSFLICSSIDLNAPSETTDQKAVMARGDNFYVSTDNIYISAEKYDYQASQYNYTELIRFSYNDGKIVYQAHGLIDGTMLNQFSMDEKDGFLRLVATLHYSKGESTNSLYILEPQLEVVGKIENLAPGERIYSARFMGNTGYFVTYRETDPLFSADLSDPQNPVILGQLKIPGFSQYLHFWSQDLLFGLGQEYGLPEEGGNFKGLKMSMFDISKSADVKEIDKLVVKEYENTPAWYSHKAILISPEKNLIGFAVNKYLPDRTWSNEYVIYGYDKNNGFYKKAELPCSQGENIQFVRGLYIGDYFYVTGRREIQAFTGQDFQKCGSLTW